MKKITDDRCTGDMFARLVASRDNVLRRQERAN
jgi:hypothetical protein